MFEYKLKPGLRRQIKHIILFLIAGIILVALFEIICASALRVRQGRWIYKKLPNYNYILYEPDDRLVGIPRKSVSLNVNGIFYQHNSQGYRGDDFSKRKTKKSIACIGGSTTYCVGVNNNQTWAYFLDSLLPDYEVMNFGIPGHSSVEHKKLITDVMRLYSPDIVIIHAGLNDLRCMNVNELASDYSNFHQPTLYGSFGFCLQDRLPHSGLLTTGLIALRKLRLISPCPFHAADFSGTITDSVDQRVVEIFSRNVDTLILQCSIRYVPVILLPQILSKEIITETNYNWWVPYLTKKGIFNALDIMNGTLKSKAGGTGVSYYDIKDNWEEQYFADPSHLNSAGNLKLAKMLSESIDKQVQNASPN